MVVAAAGQKYLKNVTLMVRSIYYAVAAPMDFNLKNVLPIGSCDWYHKIIL